MTFDEIEKNRQELYIATFMVKGLGLVILITISILIILHFAGILAWV